MARRDASAPPAAHSAAARPAGERPRERVDPVHCHAHGTLRVVRAATASSSALGSVTAMPLAALPCACPFAIR